jgi:hypothetical protein
VFLLDSDHRCVRFVAALSRVRSSCFSSFFKSCVGLRFLVRSTRLVGSEHVFRLARRRDKQRSPALKLLRQRLTLIGGRSEDLCMGVAHTLRVRLLLCLLEG